MDSIILFDILYGGQGNVQFTYDNKDSIRNKALLLKPILVGNYPCKKP